MGGRAPSSSPPLAASAMTIQKNQVRLPAAYLWSNLCSAASVLSTRWPPAGLAASGSSFPGAAAAGPWQCQPASFSSSACRQHATSEMSPGWIGLAGRSTGRLPRLLPQAAQAAGCQEQHFASLQRPAPRNSA